MAAERSGDEASPVPPQSSDTDPIADDATPQSAQGTVSDTVVDKADNIDDFEDKNDSPSDQDQKDNGHRIITNVNNIKCDEGHRSSNRQHGIAYASPADIDLLADDASTAGSEQSATKRAWAVLKVCYLISGPLLIVGIALLVLGLVGVPASFDLLPIGIAVFVVSGLVFAGSTGLLCAYKVKKMKVFEFWVGNETMHDDVPTSENIAYVA